MEAESLTAPGRGRVVDSGRGLAAQLLISNDYDLAIAALPNLFVGVEDEALKALA
jgi:hypothetical protein